MLKEPPPWLKAMRKSGTRASVPPVIIEAAASPVSLGNASTCSRIGGPSSRSMPTGFSGCTKIAALNATAASKNGRKRGSPIGTPATCVPSSTPARPSSRMQNSSSSIARATSCNGTAPNPMKRVGACATIVAIRSFR